MSNLKSALENTMDGQITEYEKDMESPVFSPRFEKRMSRMIKSVDKGSFVFSRRSIPLRKAVQLSFIILVLAVLAVAANAFMGWSSFRVDEYDTYSMINATDCSDAPLTLEERYEIGADLSGYEAEILIDKCFMFGTYYTDLYNKDKTFEFYQSTKDSLQNLRIDTEEALQKPTSIEVNNSIGMYLQFRNGSHYILWDNGDYFIEVFASEQFSIDEVISICNSVQKAE